MIGFKISNLLDVDFNLVPIYSLLIQIYRRYTDMSSSYIQITVNIKFNMMTIKRVSG